MEAASPPLTIKIQKPKLHDRSLYGSRGWTPALYGRDDPHVGPAVTPGLVAATEPALYGRDDSAKAREYQHQRVRPQRSPPCTGGTTYRSTATPTSAAAGRNGARPVRAGRQGDAALDRTRDAIAATEPALYGRDDNLPHCWYLNFPAWPQRSPPCTGGTTRWGVGPHRAPVLGRNGARPVRAGRRDQHRRVSPA